MGERAVHPGAYPSAPGEYMKDVLAEMERLNVTAVVFGDPKSVQKWKDAAPARVIPGTAFENGMASGQHVALARVAQILHQRRLQSNGRDRSPIRGHLAERSLG